MEKELKIVKKKLENFINYWEQKKRSKNTKKNSTKQTIWNKQKIAKRTNQQQKKEEKREYL